MFLFFFTQNTAYDLRISDWSSDVCSSDLDYDRRSRILRSFLWLFGRSYIRLGVSRPGRTPSLACAISGWPRFAGPRQAWSTVSADPSGLIDNDTSKFDGL